MTRIRTALAVCAFAVLALASCSGGGDDKAAQTTPPTGPTTTVPVPTSFTGQDSTQFCTLARTYNERFTSVGANPTPAQLRTATREGQTAISQALNSAPAEIKGDVQLLATAFNGLLAELEKVNFEATRLPPAALGQLSTPEFQTSTTRFQAYTRTVCGVG